MTNPTDTNPDVLIAFVLDASGSMLGHVPATIEGFNKLVEDQRAEPGEAYLSLTIFDTNFETRYVGEHLSEVAPLGDPANPYRPGGGTALLDAVGTTVKGAEAWLQAHPDFGGKVLVVILTDGQENRSQQWHLRQPMVEGDDLDLGGLIQWKQTEGWQFVFLGAGGSAWLEQAFGHVVGAAQFSGYTASAAGHADTYAGVSRGMSATRSKGVGFTAPRTAAAVADLAEAHAIVGGLGENASIAEVAAARQGLRSRRSERRVEGTSRP